MHLDKLDDKWMIAGQNRQQDRAGREKGFSGNLLLSVTLLEGIMLGTMYIGKYLGDCKMYTHRIKQGKVDIDRDCTNENTSC